MSILSVNKNPEKLPQDRRCKKKGCDGRYHLIYNSVSCVNCGHHPWSQTPPPKRTRRYAKDEPMDINIRIDHLTSRGVYDDEPIKPKQTEAKREYNEAGELVTKECLRCDQIKPVTEFGLKLSSSDGIQTYCRECQNYYARQSNRKRHREKIERDGKICPGCRELKPYSEYHVKRASYTGIQSVCKECNRSRVRQQYKKKTR